MVPPSWLLAVGLAPAALASIPPPDANSVALPVVDFCPEQCAVAGPNTTNWPVYPNLKTIRFCPQTMFLDFSLQDTVDDPDATHRIQACSSFGSDFYNMAPASQKTVAPATSESVDVQFELGWWEEAFGLAKPAIRSLVGQIREYIDGGHGRTDRPFIFYGRSAQASVGVYIGQGLLNQALSASAFQIFQDNFDAVNATTPSLAMQLCDPSYDSTHIFGIAVSSNGTFSSIQNAIQSWADATCLSFAESRNYTGTATFLTPLRLSNGTDSTTNSTLPSNSTMPTIRGRRTKILHARAECKVVQVESGNGCAELTGKCNDVHKLNPKLTGDQFMKLNPGICDKLKPKQRVCCTEGTLPDFRPPQNPDGSCFAYTIQQDDNCANLAAEYTLTVQDIEDFNKKTWGWGGCDLLFKDTIMCLSSGRPPFPAVIPNAICGPQAPNTTKPTDPNFDISKLNPCPLNACCNIWGQCGTTQDFCIDTNTGPPGTAKKGTYGCISNCGLDPVKGTGNGAIKLGYFQGYGLGRPCLYQDALQIDTSKFNHLHFGFGTLTPDTYEVGVGDALATYQFEQFKRVPNAKRILSFGGWAFSTEPATYFILREGVKRENRMKMATNIANFIKKHELDGVDIDWEYPGAPDLPEFDPGKKEDGQNYLEFLVVLKNLLPGKSVAIAAPASYYYLKQFPIQAISRVVDYIVYMTYDLHGQWDHGSKYTQEGCELGNCLRSQVNLTETRQALAMITKAGVPGNKIVVGVTSYGRSFNMAQSGCWGPGCTFTGDRLTSHATPGRCTGQGGYLADAEILEIINGRTNMARSVGENVTDIEAFGQVAKRQSNRVVTHFLDPGSHSDVLVYDNNQWVAYMSENTKRVRTQLYTVLGMAGITDWATDLQVFNPVPKPQKNWGAFIALAATGANPKEDTNTSIGKWKDFTCTHEAVSNWGQAKMTPAMRWKAVDADSAWREIVAKWFNTDKDNRLTFIESVQLTTKMGTAKKCHTLDEEIDNCDAVLECDKGADGPDSGPAAYLIWHSLVQMHKMHHTYWRRLLGAWGSMGTSIDDMQNTFAPIPEPKTNQWLNVLLDLLTIGTLTAGAPFFNRMLRALPAAADPTSLNDAKDFALNLAGQSTTLAKDLLDAPPQDKWTPQEQAKFSNYVGQVIFGWMNVTEQAVKKLFDGSQESVKVLGNVMAGGTLLEGWRASGPEPGDDGSSGTQLLGDVRKSLFGFSIPALWRVSKTYAFVLDSGASCGGNPASKYVDDKTADATGVCYEGRQYYLVHTDGEARPCKCERVTDVGPCQTICRDNKFSAPVGIDELSRFGVSKEDLVIGSIRTFRHAGRKNGVNIDPVTVSPRDLADVKITTPGFVRLPVCSPDRAWQSWHTTSKGNSPNFPCDIPPGKDHCGNSDFENKTSPGSPLVSDCEQIIRNIEGDGSTQFTHRITGHREILDSGSCHFGIQRTGGTGGTVEFRVGGQDVIDIINESIKRYGGGGRVGARGVMPCSGVTAGTKVNVEWGIY
ncbi:hypothetical protein V8F06_009825 [Rhypophila decipiens]